MNVPVGVFDVSILAQVCRREAVAVGLAGVVCVGTQIAFAFQTIDTCNIETDQTKIRCKI